MRISALRSALAVAAGAAVLVTAACGSSGPSGGSTTAGGGKTTGVHLSLLIGSSGDAETNAVNAAGKAWAAKSGNTVSVTPAKDLVQELTQSLAGGTPPDLFYVDASKVAGLVKANALAAYGDQLPNKGDFYPSLVKSFTENGKFYCAPKDFSTLALEINTDMWTKAGLTDADIPTNWDQLETVAKKLTKGKVAGLVMSDTLDRVDAFMRQAGGSLMNADGTEFTANSPENLAGLQYVTKLAKEGVLKFPKQVDAGWGGEALGKNKAAMTIEGNWIVGGVKSDYPNLHYKVVELPAGPKGKATLSFTNCWGIAAKSKNQSAAVDFVKFLTSTHPADDLRQGVRRDAVRRVGEVAVRHAVPGPAGIRHGRRLRDRPHEPARLRPGAEGLRLEDHRPVRRQFRSEGHARRAAEERGGGAQVGRLSGRGQ